MSKMNTYNRLDFKLKDKMYINGKDSLMFFLDWTITVFTVLYNKKCIVKAETYDILPINEYVIDLTVYNWNIYYRHSFEQFISTFCDYVTYNNSIPFCWNLKVRSHNKFTYRIILNDIYYKQLDSSFKFPNFNIIIQDIVEKFYIHLPPLISGKLISNCTFEFPINNKYLKTLKLIEVLPLKKQTIETLYQSIQTDMPTSLIENTKKVNMSCQTNIDFDISSMHIKLDYYSKMINHIYEVSQRTPMVDPNLMKTIKTVYQIKTLSYNKLIELSHSNFDLSDQLSYEITARELSEFPNKRQKFDHPQDQSHVIPPEQSHVMPSINMLTNAEILD